jgi:hypothetical protein
MERTLLKPPKGKNTTDLQHALPSLFFIGDSLNFRNKSNGLPHRCAQGESIIKKKTRFQNKPNMTQPFPYHFYPKGLRRNICTSALNEL